MYENKLPLLNRRLQENLRHNNLTDIHLVGDDNVPVPAFRLVLACASPVFEKMLFGGFAEAKKDTILIPDTSERVLRALVQFCLTDSVVVDESEFQTIQEELQDLMQLAVLGNTYEISGLVEPVKKLFNDKLYFNPGMSCPLLAEMHPEACPQLYQATLAIIQKAPHAALMKKPSTETPGIACLPPDKLQELLQTAPIQKIFLEMPRFAFQRLLEWYRAHDNGDSEESCRQAMTKLNLVALPPKDLEKMVEKAPFLTTELLETIRSQQEAIGTVTDCRFGKGIQCSLVKVDSPQKSINTYYKRISDKRYTATTGDGDAVQVFYHEQSNQWQITDYGKLQFCRSTDSEQWFTSDSTEASNIQVRCACQRMPPADRW